MPDLDLSIQKSLNPVSKTWSSDIFIRFYVSARTSGLLAAMGAENVQTFLAIATFMDSEGQCYPTQEQIGDALGLSRRQAVRRIQQLLAFEWQGQPLVRAVRVRMTDGTWDNLRYTILPEAPVGFGSPKTSDTVQYLEAVGEPQDPGGSSENPPQEAIPVHVTHMAHGSEDHVTPMPHGTDVTLTRTSVCCSMSPGSGSPSLQSPTVISRERARIAQDPRPAQEPSADSAPTPPVPALAPVPDWEQELADQYGENRLRQALACLREAEARGQVIEHPRAFVLRAIEKGWQPSQRVLAPAAVPARGPDAVARLREQWDRENEERCASQEAERRVLAWFESQPADLQDKLRQGALALAQRDIGKLFPEGVPGAVVDGYLYRLAVVAMEDRGTGVDGAETGRELQGGAAASSAAVSSVESPHDRRAAHVRVQVPADGAGFAVAPLGDEAASEDPWAALAPAVGAEGLVRPVPALDTPRSAVRLRRADPVNISLGGAVAIRQETG